MASDTYEPGVDPAPGMNEVQAVNPPSGGPDIQSNDAAEPKELEPLITIPADHLTANFVPAGEAPPGGQVAVDPNSGVVVKDVAQVDEERAAFAEEQANQEGGERSQLQTQPAPGADDGGLDKGEGDEDYTAQSPAPDEDDDDDEVDVEEYATGGGWYRFPDGHSVQGKMAAEQYVADNPDATKAPGY